MASSDESGCVLIVAGILATIAPIYIGYDVFTSSEIKGFFSFIVALIEWTVKSAVISFVIFAVGALIAGGRNK